MNKLHNGESEKKNVETESNDLDARIIDFLHAKLKMFPRNVHSQVKYI